MSCWELWCLFLPLAWTASGAEAEKKKKTKKKDAAPVSAQIAESMGDLKWGMTKDEVMEKFVGKLRDKYRPLIAKTKDAVEEDRLRQEAKTELEAIKKGFVEFNGTSSGWNVSFLKGEFTHGNDESMSSYATSNSQNFYFFIGGKLWKWYKAFDAAVFPRRNFVISQGRSSVASARPRTCSAEIPRARASATGSSGRTSRPACARSTRLTSTASTASSSRTRTRSTSSRLAHDARKSATASTRWSSP